MADAGPPPPTAAAAAPPSGTGVGTVPPSGRNKKKRGPGNNKQRNKAGRGPGGDAGPGGPADRLPRRRNNNRRNNRNRNADGGPAQRDPNNPNPASGLGQQLPHVKVTVRNIVPTSSNNDPDDPALTHGGVVDMIAGLVEGVFPPPGRKLAEGSASYLEAWKAERIDFEAERAMFAGVVGGGRQGDAAETATAGGSPGAATTPPGAGGGRGYPFAGWAYEDRPALLPPGDRPSLLPSVPSVVSTVLSALPPPGDIVRPRPTLEDVVDRAAAEMLGACSAVYLTQCGGRAEVDRGSKWEVSLPGELGRVRGEMEREREEREALEGIARESEGGDDEAEGGGAGTPDAEAEVAKVEGVKAETTAEAETPAESEPPAPAIVGLRLPPAERPASGAVRVRILSVTPARRSKRRGVVGGRACLVLYPPDPSALFGDLCRDAGEAAAAGYRERYPDCSGPSEEAGVAGVGEGGSKEGPDGPAGRAVLPRPPQLPAAERGRCLARSRVLLSRTVSALRRHASSGGSGGLYAGWDIDESPSQKAWRPRNHGPAVERLEAAGGTAEKEKALRELVGAVAASGGAHAGDGSDGSAAPGGTVVPEHS